MPTYALDSVMEQLESRYAHQPEFLQALEEVLHDVIPFINEHDYYQGHAILERMVEPDRVIAFRVTWVDDAGEIQVNRAYRVQFNGAIGPYKGGIRFDPSVNLSVLKFLGFEQTFKNALTGLPMGGGKGGSDFDPRGRSDQEVMRFCQALMTELFRHVGPETDVPAGDINVGAREIGYLYGQYRKISNRWNGTLTGKGPEWGGSYGRTEATGHGLVYLVEYLLQDHDKQISEQQIVISGAGNVAMHAAEKAVEMGATVLTLSDSGGYIHKEGGLSREDVAAIKKLKIDEDGRLSDAPDRLDVTYHEGQRPWSVACDVTLPCATQNEIDKAAAESLVSNEVCLVAEGANMPTTNEAMDHFQSAGVILAPGKAANAAGVAVSGLEMNQNASFTRWTKERVDQETQRIMQEIYNTIKEAGTLDDGTVDLVKGANIAGFKRVATAMIQQGI